MNLHFGETVAKNENLYLDFEQMKRTFNGYEQWNPNYNNLKKFEGGYEEQYVQDMTEQLLAKTKAANSKY